MTPRDWLAMFCRYGSILDAYAATAQKVIMDALPETEQDRVRFIQDDERGHAKTQYELAERLSPGLAVPPTPYFRKIQGDHAYNPLYMATWLVIAETMYELSFRGVGKRAKALGYPDVYYALIGIAQDEAVHARLGIENVHLLGGAPPEMVDEIGQLLDYHNSADPIIAVGLPQGLGIPPLGTFGSRLAACLKHRLTKD